MMALIAKMLQSGGGFGLVNRLVVAYIAGELGLQSKKRAGNGPVRNYQ